jgi:hypothetical protein
LRTTLEEAMPIAPFDQPLEVKVVEGEVVLSGPNGLNGSLTKAAARESARRLLAALAVDGDEEEEILQTPTG